MESSSCCDSSFTRVGTCLESDSLNHQLLPDSNYKSEVDIENSMSRREIALNSIDKSNYNILVSNQSLSCSQCNSSISNQSFVWYYYVSNDNLLNDYTNAYTIETLGNNYECQAEISHTPKTQVCVKSKFEVLH